MNKITNYVIGFAEELGKEGYSIVKAGVNTFYKANAELAEHTINNYVNVRFEVRLEDFAFEQEQISHEQKKAFYENIDSKKLNYLFELLDKAKTTAHDLHAKILSKIYSNLLKNGELNYFESVLISNINILNEKDLYIIFNNLKSIDLNNLTLRHNFKVESYDDKLAFNKCLQLGLCIVFEQPTPVTNNIGGYNLAIKPNNPLGDIPFRLTNYTKEFIEILKIVLDE